MPVTKSLQRVRRFGAETIVRDVEMMEENVAQKMAADARQANAGGLWTFTALQSGGAKYHAHPWDVVLCDPTAGSILIFFPDPTTATVTGTMIRIKNDSASATSIIMAAVAGKTIDGATTNTLGSARGSRLFQSNGVEWKVL